MTDQQHTACMATACLLRLTRNGLIIMERNPSAWVFQQSARVLQQLARVLQQSARVFQQSARVLQQTRIVLGLHEQPHHAGTDHEGNQLASFLSMTSGGTAFSDGVGHSKMSVTWVSSESTDPGIWFATGHPPTLNVQF